jgi:hypothetical protein
MVVIKDPRWEPFWNPRHQTLWVYALGSRVSNYWRIFYWSKDISTHTIFGPLLCISNPLVSIIPLSSLVNMKRPTIYTLRDYLNTATIANPCYKCFNSPSCSIMWLLFHTSCSTINWLTSILSHDGKVHVFVSNFEVNSQKTWERKTSIEWKQFWPCVSKKQFERNTFKKSNAKPILLVQQLLTNSRLHVSRRKLKLDAWILHNYGGCENSK